MKTQVLLSWKYKWSMLPPALSSRHPAAEVSTFKIASSDTPPWETGLILLLLAKESMNQINQRDLNPEPLNNEARALPMRYSWCPLNTKKKMKSKWPESKNEATVSDEKLSPFFVPVFIQVARNPHFLLQRLQEKVKTSRTKNVPDEQQKTRIDKILVHSSDEEREKKVCSEWTNMIITVWLRYVKVSRSSKEKERE